MRCGFVTPRFLLFHQLAVGVIFYAKLTRHEQIDYVCWKAKMYRLMYRLDYFGHSTTFQLRQHLVRMLLFPIIDYCSLVYSDISAEQNLTIQWALNTRVRYIFGVGKSAHITPHRRQFSWLRAEGRRKYFAAYLRKKIIQNATPDCLANLSVAKVDVRSPRWKDPDPLIVPSSRTKALRNSFHMQSTTFWNSISLHIQNAPSLPVFKHLIESHFFYLEAKQWAMCCMAWL